MPSGVRGLDPVLGGGLPEYSFTVIAGPTGAGKTTLAHQVLFANASAGRPGVYFTALGEAPLKMLRYQQQFGFFDPQKVNRAIYFVNLAQRLLEREFERAFEIIEREVTDRGAALIVVDSLPVFADAAPEVQRFAHQLARYLAACQATTILVADSNAHEQDTNPVFSSADNVLRLHQTAHERTTVRHLEVLKMSGQRPLSGRHSMRIASDGVHVFPRVARPLVSVPQAYPMARLSTGVEELDHMLGGGVPAGDALLVDGSSGTGKSVLSTHFIVEGGEREEPGVLVLHDEHAARVVARAAALGLDLAALIEAGQVHVVTVRGRDPSADELLHEIHDTVREVGARRVAIDSLSGLELAVGARLDPRDWLARLLEPLTFAGVTVWVTASLGAPASAAPAFLFDDLVTLRQVERDGRLVRQLAVVKMRSSAHSSDVRMYTIDERGLRLGGKVDGDAAAVGTAVHPLPVELHPRASAEHRRLE